MSKTETPNAGHGHVRPRPDGVKARCGGPAICRVCQQERAALAQQPAASGEPVAPDWLLRTTVADLLHLLQFSSISTSSGGDDVQARKTMARLRRMLVEGPQPAPASEPVAWFCQWFNADGSPEWDQYHDRTDPMPADDEWEDRPPDRVTPLYAAPQPAPAPAAIDYGALVAAAWSQHRYAQGSGACIAFKHGAEWQAAQPAPAPDAALRTAVRLVLDATPDQLPMALDALRDHASATQPAPAVPPGWQLVPVEPTEAMLAALNGYALCAGYVPEGYRAMLAAAPTAQQEPKP